jgi:hypothetical protein
VIRSLAVLSVDSFLTALLFSIIFIIVTVGAVCDLGENK